MIAWNSNMYCRTDERSLAMSLVSTLTKHVTYNYKIPIRLSLSRDKPRYKKADMSYVIKISPSPPLQAEKNIRDVIKIDTKFQSMIQNTSYRFLLIKI